MKNYKFVVGLLLSSLFAHGAQAASVTPLNEADRPAFPPTGGGAIVLQNMHTPPAAVLAATRANKVAQLASDNFPRFVSLPTAFHYLEADRDAVQGLKVQTRLAQQGAAAESVTEPASEVLLLAGLSALAIAIRRQSPS